MKRTVNNQNVFSGPNAVKNFLNPDHNQYIPLVEVPEHLNPFTKDGVQIFAKLMNTVPLMNIKSLPALQMLQEAEDAGRLKSVKSLIENSSGNTVFSLAVLGRIFGVPKTKAIVSNEVTWGKLQLLRLFGTEIIVNEEPICPDPSDKNSGIYKAKKIGLKKGWFNPGQYENTANPRAHEKWTGKQIWDQTEGKLTLFAAGLGTTGTMFGAGNYLKSKKSNLRTLGVVRLPNNPVPGVRTENLLHEIAFDWRSATDYVRRINTKKSFEKSLDLCRAGLTVGPSSGFVFAGLLEFLKEQKDNLDIFRNEEGKIVAVFICPDSPLPYLNEYFEYLDESHFPKVENAELLINKPTQPSNSKDNLKEDNVSFGVDADEAYKLIYPLSPEEIWERIKQKKKILLKPNVLVVDIRSRGEFLHFHLPGSTRIDSYKITKDITKLISRWKKKKIFLVCSMGLRTKGVARFLREKGFEAYSIKGGSTEWSARDFPRSRPEVCEV